MKYLFILAVVMSFVTSLSAQTINEHTVVTGETLQSIATKYGVTVTELKAANTGLDEYVFAGMVLKLPSKTEGNEQVILPIDNLKDIIYLKDGSELVAKVLSVETTEIKFEQYDTDEPFTIFKSDVTSIRFEDGRVSDFTVQPKKSTTTKKKTTKR